MHTFQTPGPIDLRLELRAGKVDITAGQAQETSVELLAAHGDEAARDLIERATVEQRGGEIVVLVPKGKPGLFGHKGEIAVTIQLPTGSNVDIELWSADLVTRGELGNAKVSSGSGDISLDHAADVNARTGSGDLEIDTATGSVRTKSGSAGIVIGSIGGRGDCLSGSGDINIDRVAGNLKLKTGSGDVSIGTAGESVDIIAGSGDFTVKRVDGGRLRAKTGSGDIVVGIADGTATYLDIMTGSGDVRSSFQSSDAPTDGERTAELSIRAGSGDVVLQRA